MDPRDALQWVRQYSHRMALENPEEPLVQSLAKHVDWETQRECQGKRLYQESVKMSLSAYRGDPGLGGKYFSEAFKGVSQLDEVTEELEKLWKVVLKELDKGTTKRHISGQQSQPHDEKPSMDKLRELMEEARKKFADKQDTKLGRAKAWFRSVAQTLHDHAYIGNIFPTNDRYTSVLIGAFTACIKASMAHEKIAERISDFLEKLSDQVRSLFKGMTRRPESMYIKDHIAQFYCTLFRLLVMLLKEWYGSFIKRLTHSFGSTFEESVQKTMNRLADNVKAVKEELMEETAHQNTKDIRMILGILIQASMTGGAVDDPMRSAQQSKTQLPSVLTTNAHQSFITFDPGSSAGGQTPQDRRDGHAKQSYWTTATIQEATGWLKQYVQEERTAKLIEHCRYLSVNSVVYNRLLLWASHTTSEALWIEGPPPRYEPSQNTLTSAFMLAALRRLGIPVISYFCVYDTSQWQTFSRPEELLKMVYALIYQVSAILPKNLAADADGQLDLSSARIGRLTPQVQSLSEAIELLRDMLLVGPPMSYCILDGLQLLEKEEDPPPFRSCLMRLVDTIRNEVTRRVSYPKIVKFVLSTDAHSWMLQNAVNTGWLQAQRFDIERQDEPMRLKLADLAGGETP